MQRVIHLSILGSFFFDHTFKNVRNYYTNVYARVHYTHTYTHTCIIHVRTRTRALYTYVHARVIIYARVHYTHTYTHTCIMMPQDCCSSQRTYKTLGILDLLSHVFGKSITASPLTNKGAASLSGAHTYSLTYHTYNTHA